MVHGAAAGAGGGHHGGDQTKDPAGLKQDMFAPPVGRLEVTLTFPRMSSRAGPAWPSSCWLDACAGDVVVASRMLPLNPKDVHHWNLSFWILVGPGWPHLPLDLVVERIDFDPSPRGNQLLLRGGPHTSRISAVIGRARVRLLDALVVGVGEEEEEVVYCCPGMMEGTRVFDKTVPLNDWELPAPGDADGEPRFVVRGEVRVRVSLWG